SICSPPLFLLSYSHALPPDLHSFPTRRSSDLGGARYAGLLTGVAVAFAWSGVLVGPPVFGLVVDHTGSYAWPWLGLAAVGLVVAVALPRPAPLVQREPASSEAGST